MFSALISLWFFKQLCFSNVKQFCLLRLYVNDSSAAVCISFFKRKDEGRTDYWSMVSVVHGMKLPSLEVKDMFLFNEFINSCVE